MDYDLSRLGTREFEHLAQSLTLKAFGPSLAIFGDGPDGGREAAFYAPVSYSTASGPWDGPGVVQAKFRQSQDRFTSDTVWLGQAIRAEFSSWLDARSRRGAIPDYILFVTNVKLSSVPNTGGQKKINDLIESYASKLGLRGYDVWHYSKVCRLLDDVSYREIRKRYAGFITPGDVLSRLYEMLEQKTESLEQVWANHAIQEMLSQRSIKLSYAPTNTTGNGISLTDVAIDLPAIGRERDATTTPDIVSTIVRRGDRVLRPSEGEDAAKLARIVLVGGPGQGKSTVSQILCQLYRSELLSSRESASIGGKAFETLQSLLSCWDSERFQRPAVRRWPIYINLSAYGDAILGGEDITLLRYIAERVSMRSAVRVTASDLKQWLCSWPWLVVLDGFDEVSAPSTRRGVEQAVDDFLLEARSCDADLLTVATTRPQGYYDEFAPSEWEHLHLTRLPLPVALAYGKRIARTLHEEDPDNQERVMQRLTEASTQESTVKLLGTPLQITIMAVLLDRRNRVPGDRHSLFESYYNTIYSREAAKGGLVSRLLDEHQPDIDYLHAQVGLALQICTESGHEPRIPSETLRRMAVDRLVERGQPESDIPRMADQVIKAATERLVMLVPAHTSDIGFELRSIQEYMAARALVSGADETVIERLAQLATLAHWRNTWLFAVGRMLAHKDHLADKLLSAIRELDVTDSTSAFLLPGAQVALEILCDEMAATSPRLRRLLLAHALELLRLPPNPPLDSLIKYLNKLTAKDADLVSVVKPILANALSTTGVQRVSAIALVINLNASQSPLAIHRTSLLRREVAKSGEEGVVAESRYCCEPIFGDGNLMEVRRSIGETLRIALKSIDEPKSSEATHVLRVLDAVKSDENWVDISSTHYEGFLEAQRVFHSLDVSTREKLTEAARNIPLADLPNYAAFWRLMDSWFSRRRQANEALPKDDNFAYMASILPSNP